MICSTLKEVQHWHLTLIPAVSSYENVGKPFPDAIFAPGSRFYSHQHERTPVFPSLRQRWKNLTLFSVVNLFNGVSRLKWLVWTCLGKYQGLGRCPMMLWFMVSLLHPPGKIPVWISDCENLCVSYLILTSLKHENTRGPEAYMAPDSWITYSCSFTSL